MDFLQLIIRMFDGCVGLLEVLTLVLDGAALYLGVKTYQKHQRAAHRLTHAHEYHKGVHKKPSWWPFAVVLAGAAGLTSLTLIKWLYLAP